MNAIDSSPPGRLAGAAASDAAGPGAAGSSTKAAAQAWQREMERQQQAWFLPALPASPGMVWAVPPAPVAVSETAPPFVEGTAAPARPAAARPDDATAMHDEPAAGPHRSGHTATAAVVTEAQPPAEAAVPTHGALPSSRPPAAGETDRRPSRSTAEPAGLAEPFEADATAPVLRETEAGGASQRLRQQPVASWRTALPARLQDFVATVQGGLDVRTEPVLPSQTMRQGPVSAGVTLPSGTVPAAERFAPDEAAELEAKHAGSPRPAVATAATAAPPMRVHCDWQDGQWTVWIGHDRGHAGSAAMLVQAIERWLAAQRLPSASFVVNGEPVEGAAGRTAYASDAAAAASDEPSDPPLEGTPHTAFRRAFTQRENT